MVSFREYPEDVSTKRIAHAINEAWQVCLQSHGAARVIAGFVYKLREDPTWSEEEIQAVMAGIRERLHHHGQSFSSERY